MSYTTDNVLTKTTPYNVLNLISKNSDGSYPTEIARNINVQQPTISDILISFETLNVVKKGKRTKAQYYKLNREGLWKYQKEIINNDVFTVSQTEFNHFLDLYFDKVKASTVNQMIEDWSKVVMAKYDMNTDQGTLWVLNQILKSNQK